MNDSMAVTFKDGVILGMSRTLSICIRAGYIAHHVNLQAPTLGLQPERILRTESPTSSHKYKTRSGAADPARPLIHKLLPISCSTNWVCLRCETADRQRHRPLPPSSRRFVTLIRTA
jgi:hypothetical protein